MPLSINDDTEFETSTSSSDASLIIAIKNFEPNASVTGSDALNAVIKYHLDGEGHSRLMQEVPKWIGLSVVAAFGVIFYYVPAKAYAETICTDPRYKDMPCGFFVISHLGGTLVVAGTILINATNAYLEELKAGGIPLKLVNYLEYPCSAKQKTTQEVMTLVGSLIASIPFPILSLVNPVPGLPIAINISEAFLIWMTNTFLHLLPVSLAFKNWLYRLPFLPIEFTAQKIVDALMSAEEKQEKELQAQINQHYQTIKQRLINHLDQAQRLLSIYGFRFTGYDYKELTHSPLQLLIQLFNRLHAMSPNRTIAPPGRINRFLRQAAYFPGAMWVILACGGFVVGPPMAMTKFTGDPVFAAAISAPSIYCFGVLLAFFGGNALQNSYDYLTAWKDDTVKIPMAFKLYPKTSVLLIMISMYLSAFSYAAGAQLINDNFNGNLGFLRPYLLDIAKTGLTFLGFTAMIDFFNNVLSKFAQYGGAEDAQTVTELCMAFSQMKNSIQLMKPAMFVSSLSAMDKEQLKSILNIKDEIDLQNFSATLIQLAQKLKTKILKEAASIKNNKENIDETSLCKLLHQLDKDESYTTEKIEAWLIKYSESLCLGLKQVCHEYKAVCELMHTLDSIRVIRELDVFPDGSNSYAAGPSSEITPLLVRGPQGSILTRFFRQLLPAYEGESNIAYLPTYYGDSSGSSISSPLLNSSQMGV